MTLCAVLFSKQPPMLSPHREQLKKDTGVQKEKKKRYMETHSKRREEDNREKTSVLSVRNAPIELKIGIGTVATELHLRGHTRLSVL